MEIIADNVAIAIFHPSTPRHGTDPIIICVEWKDVAWGERVE